MHVCSKHACLPPLPPGYHRLASARLSRPTTRSRARAAQSLLGLLNDILDLSKAESGKMTLDPHPVHRRHLLADLRVIVDAYIGVKPVQLIFDLDTQAPACLLADALRLKQVLRSVIHQP